MTDKKTSELAAGTTLAASDLVPIVQGSTTKKITVENFAATLPFTPSGSGAVARTVQAVLREIAKTPQDFGAVGDGVTNDSAAWTAWTNYCQDGTGRRGYIPAGTYLIDSWVIGGYSGCFDGEAMGVGALGGVRIKCRTACTNFVLIDGVGHELSNVRIDGNNLATNTIRLTNTLSDLTFRKVTATGCVNGGIDWNFTPITPNIQVDLCNFYDCTASGRSGGTTMTGIKIDNVQSQRIMFHSPTIAGYEIGYNHNTGGSILRSPVFLNNTLNDIKFSAGLLVVLEGRSESAGIDSVNIANGAGGRVSLIEYTHASTTLTTTSLNIASGFTGNLNVVGGLYDNIANASATAGVTLINPEISAGGVLYGTYADRVVWIKDSLIRAPRMASVQNVPTYGTTVTIDASLGDVHTLIVNDGVGWTLAAPTNPTNFQEITLEISNTSGGAMGVITVNSIFKTAGALTAPATANRRFYAFRYNGANWIEQWRSAADTPN